MYQALAEHYDRIYHNKPYAAEAEVVAGVLAGLGIPDGSRLLDAACGTGSHLQQLADRYQVSGFDLHPAMLEIARRKVPAAELWVGDLREFQVPEPFDAAVCLFSAIGYLLTREDLAACARCFAAAVRPGGVVLIEPWLTVADWKDGAPHLQTGPPDPDVLVARATVSQREGEFSIMPMNWMIARRNGPVEVVVDVHRMWLCPHETLLMTFREAGFDANLASAGFSPGRPLLVAKRVSDLRPPAP
jgi:daunosaminyl-N,N-dimethyltransferase/N-dimethyltransferase